MIQRTLAATFSILFTLGALIFVLFLNWTFIILFACLAVASFVFFLVLRQFNIKIRIRELTSTGIRLIWDRYAKLTKDSEKIEFYKIFMGPKGHETLPLAPAEAIDYDGKTKSVEAWWHPEMGYMYVKDCGPIEGFQPMNTRMRGLIVSEIKKKESRKSKGWKENIPLIAGLSFVLILIISVLIFAPEYMKALRETTDAASATTAAQNAITERQEQIVSRLDRMQGVDSGIPQIIESEAPSLGGSSG